MIRIKAGAPATIAIIGLAGLLAPVSADPAPTIEAQRLVRERAAAAVITLDELREAIEPGLEAAREAAAAVLTGEEPPAEGLAKAADLIVAAEAAVRPARRSVAWLTSARIALRPGAAPVPEPVPAGELSSIGAQLRATGEAADAFVDLRMRALGVPELLEQAFRALEDGSLDQAAALAEGARSGHAAVASWETDLPTLPVWIVTTDAMISAVDEIIDANRRGDRAGAIAAAEAFAAIGEDAATADRALRIALSEGGSALTSAPLGRLAAALGTIESSRTASAALVERPGP